MSYVTNVSTILGLMGSLNTVTNDLGWNLIVGVVYVSIYLIIRSQDPLDGLLISNFVTLIFATLLYFSGLVASATIGLLFAFNVVFMIAKFMFK